MKTIFIGVLSIILGSNISRAQTIGSDVMVTLVGTGTPEWKSVTYNDGSGRVDYLTNQVSVNLQFHPYSPQADGFFFSSASADFSGSINVRFTGIEEENGLILTDDNLQNQPTYANQTAYSVATAFFGTPSIVSDAGSVSSLSISPPVLPSSRNPQPYQLYYDGTNNVLSVWVSLPSPFSYDPYPSTDQEWDIPCTATVTGNDSSFAGTVDDASTGKPIPNAAVSIGGQNLMTDVNGKFFVPYLAPGSLTIQISAPGYVSYENTAGLPPFSAIQQTFPLRASGAQFMVLDANPVYLSSLLLPQSIDNVSLAALVGALPVRSKATADGTNELLLQFTSSIPGAVSFTQSGAAGGTLRMVSGAALPASGVSTATVGNQQMAFALYTVPDTVSPGGDSVSLNALFTPNGSSTATQQASSVLNLLQTPVALVHGLWANRPGTQTTWHNLHALLNAINVTNVEANYYDPKLQSAGQFAAYRGVVNESIQNMVHSMRAMGIAASRADVVAHSMGGILTRIDANDKGYYFPENYNCGFVRRVITVDTPHWGSCAAPVLSLLAGDAPWLGFLLGATGHPVDKGAVKDLSPSSFAISLGGMTSAAYKSLQLPSYAIGCAVGTDSDFDEDPALRSLYWWTLRAALGLNSSQQTSLNSLLCNNAFTKSDDYLTMAKKIFLGQASDEVVTIQSQNGDCDVSFDYVGFEHTAAPTNQTIMTDIITLLEGSASAFATSFPTVNQTDLNTQECNTVMPAIQRIPEDNAVARDQKPLMSLLSPSNGVVLTPGANIAVSIEPFSGVNLQMVALLLSANAANLLSFDTLTNAPFAETIPCPTNFFGPLSIIALGIDDQGNYDIEQAAAQVVPGTNITLESLSADVDSFGTKLSFAQLGVSQSLQISGTYSDGGVRDITLGAAGTTYSTSAASVAVVDTNGNVTAIGNGSAQITVMNGGLIFQVPVQANLQPPQLISIQPDNIQPGGSHTTVSIVGNNLGGASNIVFLRNGQPDTNLTVQALQIGPNAANIQATLNASSTAVPGLLTAVVTTPVGNSGIITTQGNRFFIGQPLVLSNVGFTNSPTRTAFGFTITGTAGSSFTVQASTNLADWVNETTNSPVSGTFNFIDTSPPVAAKYYRVQISL